MLLVLLLFPIGVRGEWVGGNGWECQLRTNCTVARQLLDVNLQPVNNASCTIQVMNGSSMILLLNSSLGNATYGFYNYTNSYNSTGLYPATVRCVFDGNLTVFDATFLVVQGEAVSWQTSVVLTILGMSSFLILLSWYYKKNSSNHLLKIVLKNFSILISFVLILALIQAARLILLQANEVVNSASVTGIYNILGSIYVGFLWFFVFLAVMIFSIFVMDVLSLFKDAKRLKNWEYTNLEEDGEGEEE